VERLRRAQNRDVQARAERAVPEPLCRGDEGGLLKCPMPPSVPARGPVAAGLRTTGVATSTRDRGGGTATEGAGPPLPADMAPAGKRRERLIWGGIRCARSAVRWEGSSRRPWSTTSSRTRETAGRGRPHRPAQGRPRIVLGLGQLASSMQAVPRPQDRPRGKAGRDRILDIGNYSTDRERGNMLRVKGMGRTER
jgi:hypothetical protein